MSYFSSPESSTADEVAPKKTMPLTDDKCAEEETTNLIHKKNESSNSLMAGESPLTSSSTKSKTPSKTPLEIEEFKKLKKKTRVITICGSTYSRHHIGLCSALACGIWGGSCLVPMHYATGNVKGLGYVISFSIGAISVTILMWLLRYMYHLITLSSIWEAYEALPSFHLRVMWAPGAAAGILWSMGNVGSILAVEHLGQGVGYSASQASLLVSGMWGIFFFKVWWHFLFSHNFMNDFKFGIGFANRFLFP